MTTTNMSLNEPSVGSTSGPTWASETNDNWTSIDQHDHTSGKGVQLTPSGLNINADLEFNGNAATELERLTFDSSATGSGTSYSVYQLGGNLYWYNGSGQAVQITNGTNVKTTGGSIDGMDSTDAGADYGSGYFKWEFDTTKTPFAGAKMKNADIELHKYDGSSGSDAYVILKYTGSSEGSNNLTFPDETGTVLSTATSFAGAISIANTSGAITIDAETDLNLDANGGNFYFKDGGTAIGKISNSSSDLVIENEVDAKDIIFQQFDGSEVVRMADDRRLYFFDKGGEYIYGDGTDLYLVSGAVLNVNTGSSAGNNLKVNTSHLVVEGDTGNVGIGVTDPDAKLEVNAGTTNTTGVHIDRNYNGDAGSYLLHIISGANETTNPALYVSQAGSGPAASFTGGNVEVSTGNLVISTAGQGITFGGDPDTRQNSPTVGDRTLYDYEEGTWNGQISAGGNNMAMNGSYVTGYYTKIGNVCHISGNFRTYSKASATGNVKLGGLPFDIASGSAALVGGTVGYGNGFSITAGESLSLYGPDGADYVELIIWNSGGGAAGMTVAEWDEDGSVVIGLSYRVG